MKLTAIDLFCGAGGLSRGLIDAGFDVIAGVENNPVAAETYRANYPGHHLVEADITTVDPLALMRDLGINRGQLDLLAGCPPCQGFSTHRTRRKSSAVEDSRNDLVFEYLRFVKELHPKVVMMENVPALAVDDRAHLVLRELVKLGYAVTSRSLQVKDAADYGVPQRRKRMILVASRFGEVSEPSPVAFHSTVRDYLSNMPLPGSANDVLHDYVPKRADKVQEMITLIPKDGGSRKDLPKEYWLPCHLKGRGGYLDVYGRMSWQKVSPTITGGCISPSKGRFLHPEQDRAITLREAAMLQTFPSDYYFSLAAGRDHAALMIGNALPPKFIKVHADKIKEHLISVED